MSNLVRLRLLIFESAAKDRWLLVKYGLEVIQRTKSRQHCGPHCVHCLQVYSRISSLSFPMIISRRAWNSEPKHKGSSSFNPLKNRDVYGYMYTIHVHGHIFPLRQQHFCPSKMNVTNFGIPGYSSRSHRRQKTSKPHRIVIALNSGAYSAVNSWEPVSRRLVIAQLRCTPFKATIITVYAKVLHAEV